MRKKYLLAQNTQLFDRLSAAENEIARLKEELREKEGCIAGLEAELAAATASKTEPTAPLKALEAKVKSRAQITPEAEYGAKVIGKIVVAAARHCGRLSEKAEARELINLILGRTEVAKSEILNTVSADLDFEAKKEKIDFQLTAAEDYFAGVCAQCE